MEYEAVIGLKIHARFTTQSKPWCGCANAFGAEPNTNVCPVCLGLASAGSRSAFHPVCEFHHA